MVAPAPSTCPGCGTELAPRLLVCPFCQRLVHAARLSELAGEAQAAEQRVELTVALARWRSALELLPAETAQARTISAHVAELAKRTEAAGGPIDQGPTPGSRAARWLAPLGVVGLLLWKFKFVAVLVLSKGKLLFGGLTQAGTLFSMLAAWGVYWTLWGWKFALGFVVCMYVHEIGHVAALRQLGIRATAPMFIPGLGAFVRMDQYPQSAREDARVGLAGPIWGLGASLAAWGLYHWTGLPVLSAIARTSAWLNIFNLLPVWQLDGGRGFRALSRRERGFVTALLGGAWLVSNEGLLALLAVVAGVRSFGQAPAEGDGRTLVDWILLICGLTALTMVTVPLR